MHQDAYSFANLLPHQPAPPAPIRQREGQEGQGSPFQDHGQFAAMLARENVLRAWDKVRKNNGAPGMDGITVAALKLVFAEAWSRTQAALEAGDYRPLPVRRLDFPKPGGGTRMLGIPTVMDRVVQQALAQVLSPQWEPRFSPASYAYRPGRGAHDALNAAVQWMEAGGAWAAHLDIEKFFDNVDQGRLAEGLAGAGLEARLVELVRHFLSAGAISSGIWQDTPQGTPQGSPLSPLLANIVLDGLDHRLEALGARHVRYADDLLILGRTRVETAAMIENAAAYLLAELNLRLNEEKTRLTPAHEAEFLGFGFRRLPDGRWQRAIAPAPQEAFRVQVNALTEYRAGETPEAMLAGLSRFVQGWQRYFTVPGQPWAADAMQSHARARARRWLWESWATPERRRAELAARGMEAAEAERASPYETDAPQLGGVLGKILPNAWFIRHGLSRAPKKAAAREEPRERKYPAYPARLPGDGKAGGRPALLATKAPAPAPLSGAAPDPKAGKRRGWFFNFSIGRLFTFRYLSENAPGVLARPERKQPPRQAPEP